MTAKRQTVLANELEAAKQRIAELQEGELARSRLAAIVESAEDAIISKTLEGIVTSWNAGAQRMFGYTADEIIGRPITVLIPPGHSDEEPQILSRLRRGERIEHYETQRVRKDGSIIDLSLTVSPIRDRSGKIIGASKIARDISDRKRWEENERRALRQAQEARQQAEAANRVKDEFLATVSHELRTPLTAVVGWVRMLRAGQLDSRRTERALEVIDRNIRSQAQLIEDLLDISRITMGKLRLDVRPILPTDVIRAAAESVAFAAEARDIRIQQILDSSIGPVRGDFERLQQVVWNLLSNAIKFTPKGGRVQIVLERVNSHVEIRVTDNGKGIDPEFLPHIFQRFTQADTVMTRRQGGLGLGLAIARSIIELHGGSITAHSEGREKGSTFVLSLPVMAITHERTTERVHPRAWTEISLACPPEVRGLNVLVVDDEIDTGEMIREVLENCGANVQVADSAEAAFKNFCTRPPDVLISDIGMPEVDGYEFIRRVREYERNRGVKVPAIALTAFARIEDRVKSLAAGYQMHIAKPVEPAELLTIVASLSGFIDRNY